MAVGWNWAYSSTRAEFILSLENVEISYNYVSGFMTEMADGGAIYVTGPNAPVDDATLKNFMHHNYVEFTDNTGDGRGGFLAGIYFDGASSSWHCYENVVLQNAYGAAEDETSYGEYGITYLESQKLMVRRTPAVFIYVQHIDNQETHNLLLENNIVLNVRAKEPTEQRYEVYRNYIITKDAVNGRNVIERDTLYVVGLSDIPREAARIIMGAGCIDYFGNVEEIADNVY